MVPEQTAVKRFHQLIDAPAPERPTMPSLERRRLRAELIREEAEEFAEALGLNYSQDFATWEASAEPDLVEAADALGDLLVVVYGAALELGIDMEPIFWEIHRSNMTKGGGPLRKDGKALKPAAFSPAYLEPIILRQHYSDVFRNSTLREATEPTRLDVVASQTPLQGKLSLPTRVVPLDRG